MKQRILLLMLIGLAPIVAGAQQADMDALFSWEVQLSREEIPQGASAFIDLNLSVEDEHYIYRDMTSISLADSEVVNAAEPVFPDPVMKMDPFENKEKEVYEGTATFRIPITVKPDAPTGTHTVEVNLQYQGCSPSLCYFPQNRTYPVEITVAEGSGVSAPPVTDATAAGAGSPTVGTTSASGNMVEGWLQQGLLIAFGLAFVFGLLTCLTPCVYPLIPITVTIFGARETKSTFQAFLLASIYVLGIALMYSLLGLIAASTGAMFGSVMSNPWVIGSIALIFIVMGVSMLGAFDLAVPSGVQAKLTQIGGKGFGSAFIMGTVAGVIAAPCTGPVLAGILAYVATQATPWFGFSLLFIYALGLGLPFLVLGTFSGLISKMPKSGAWMEHVKSVFGIILFVAALYFLKDVFPVLKSPLTYSTTTFIVSGVLLLIGLGMGAVHYSFHSPNFRKRLQKGLGVVCSVAALYVGVGSLTAVQASEVEWVKDLQAGLAMAEEQNKPVMIDFSADWCSVCHEIEATTFSDPQVGAALSDFVTIKVDLTQTNARNTEIQKEYGITGLPWIVFINSEGERLSDKTVTGYIGPDDFLERIEGIE